MARIGGTANRPRRKLRPKPRTDTDAPGERPFKELPDSLVRVFHAVRQTAADEEHRTQEGFLAALQRAWHTEEPIGAMAVSTSILESTEYGKKTVQLDHILAYARLERVPSGVLLLISFLLSNHLHDGDQIQPKRPLNPERSFAVANGICSLIQAYRERIVGRDRVGYSDVRMLLSAFKEGQSVHPPPESWPPP